MHRSRRGQRESEIRLRDLDIPKDSQLMRISRSILKTRGLTNINEVRRCIIACWQSLNNYISEGIGFVLLKNSDVASWCSTDYIVSGKCDLYVNHTNEKMNEFARQRLRAIKKNSRLNPQTLLEIIDAVKKEIKK